MKRKLDIVFLGTSTFGLPALLACREDGHEILSVVTQPDRPRGRGRRSSPSPMKEAARRLGIPVLQPERVGEIVPDLERLSPDALVVAAYGQVLPGSVIRSPRLASLNIHGSLLPRYRGAAPIQWALIHGEKETGVTIFRIVRKMDAGPILASRTTPIGEAETAGELEERLARVGAEAIREVLGDLPGSLERESPQEESLVTYAPRLAKEDGHLSFDQPPGVIRNRVRGLSPRPGAFALLLSEGRAAERIRILETTLAEGDTGGSPGKVLRVTEAGFTVAARGGGVTVTRLQPEGGRPMTSADYLRGHPVAPGATLE